ncbi:GNAT family N-acetyltransferase [Pigmentiphaga sp. NML080357]|uniref:GNAT family N-acetyltransferase n=1 Tax=Pigmentiphaga sp. NML080357 TaxID=2008675 RepID=UPI001E43F204|nr:GNAT family N-acetyltransferase [Pigmentiphaga sp. NML080357]
MAARHSAGFAIEAMQPAAVEAVLAVQAQAYAGVDVLEDAGLFLNRIRLSPRTCWVARGPDGVLGYLVSYPWPLGAPPRLNVPLPALPADARSWFLHDCAVAPAAAGQGVGTALVRTGLDHARKAGLACATLVSLAPARAYWVRQGFEAVEAEPEALDGYGAGACYMRRLLEA